MSTLLHFRSGGSVLPRRHGFTMLELLVFILIIALLAALLLPAIGRAKAGALSAMCKSNLRQLGLALRTYTDEFEHYPPHFPTDLPSGTLEYWPDLLTPYCNNDSRVFVCPGPPDRLGYRIA